MLRRCDLVLVAAVALAGCGAWLERWVDFRVHRILGAQVSRVHAAGFEMTVRTELENPNAVDATLTNVRFTTWIGPQRVGQGTMPGPIKVRARSRFVLDAPVHIAYASLPADLPARSASGIVALRITTRLHAATSLGSYQLKLSSTDQVRLDRALKVAIRGPFGGRSIQVDSIKLAGLGLFNSRLKVRLTARNLFAFPIRVRRARYAIAINGVHFGEGTLERPLRLAPRSSQQLELELAAPHGTLGHAALVMLAGDPRFRVTGKLWIDPIAGVKEIPLDVEADASVFGK